MQSELRAHLAFHLAGARTHGATEAVAGKDLRPALLAPYRNLAALRHDYPLVLVDDEPAGCVRSLTDLVDDVLRRLAPRGPEGERLRRDVLRLERAIRADVAAGGGGALSARWEAAAERLAAGDPAIAASLAQARKALKVDGELVGCDRGAARRVVTHVWRAVQAGKARRFRDLTRRLVLRLGDILRAELLASPAGRTADQLEASFGGHGDVFDFGAMSQILTRAAAAPAPASRQRRVKDALTVLEAQDFFPDDGPAPDSFVFDSCAAALEAYQARLPMMRRVARALAIAELEVEGLYDEARHDALLERMFERDLRPADLAMFPDYLVCIDADGAPAGEGARLLELLSAGPPVKVVVEVADLDHHVVSNGHAGFGVRCSRLGSVAMGLGQVHVVQAPASSLYDVRDRMTSAVAGPGPALVSVFTGAAPDAYALPAYLVGAAALEARAFPAFSYDPTAGSDWASRFSLAGNPQPERAWPVHRMTYADARLQRVVQEVPFTFADFAACDRRRADQFALVPGHVSPDEVPSLLMIDADEILHPVIADAQVMSEAGACADAWRSLQELGGIHNSHAEKEVARERAAWEARAVEAPAAAAAAIEAAAPVEAAAAGATEAAVPSGDDPYIETPRCSTCNECTRLNPRMFAYDGNQQAFIKDPDAGTYAELVQAAESCQLAIIHPGKPRNPKEPGLDELRERAQPFL